MFLANQPSDVCKSDKFSRWWTDWYEYTICLDIGQIIYGNRILFAPSRVPNRDKYIQRETEITLGYPETVSGTFNFEEISTTNPLRAKVKFEDWKHCRDIFLQKKHLTTNHWITNRIYSFKPKNRETHGK